MIDGRVGCPSLGQRWLVYLMVNLPVAVVGRTMHLEHCIGSNQGIVRSAAGAQNRPSFCGLVDPIYKQGLVDVNTNHLPKDQPGARLFARSILKLNDLYELALHSPTRGTDTNRLGTGVSPAS